MTILVSGGMGCIGAWCLYHLLEQNEQVVCFDLSGDRHRLDLLMSRERQRAITFVQGDLTDFVQVKSCFEANDVTHIIHLAALQVPMCRANPVLGARVNVVGTTNIFEAARQLNIRHISYASSIAVYGPPEVYPTGLLDANAPFHPQTLYGVYKVANEGLARIYWQDYGISSIVLRPYTVYGPGRDQGLTSEPTNALLAAANGQDFHISFGGRMQFHYASDVARQFILAATEPCEGALGFNLGTQPVSVERFAEVIMDQIKGVTITVGQQSLPFPEGCDPAPLHAYFQTVYETPLDEGIRQTLEWFGISSA